MEGVLEEDLLEAPAPAPIGTKKKLRRRRSSEKKPSEMFFAEDEWENELARQILVLYGSAANVGNIPGLDRDFAVDADALPESKVDVHKARQIRPKKPLKKKPIMPAPVLSSKVHAIWFLGSGSLSAEWSALPEDPSFALQLGALEERGQYAAYLALVEASLQNYHQSLQLDFIPDDDDDEGRPQEKQAVLYGRLWRQLVVTANVFGIRCVERRRYPEALELLKKAQELAAASDSVTSDVEELRAFVDDSHAFYYYKRGKCHAALDYALRAMRLHVRLSQWAHVAKCHLHAAAILSRLGRHTDASNHLGDVLNLVKDGYLDLGAQLGLPHKLCMIAIAYHNLAVEQLLLNHPKDAAVSAQNARRLARLCLSYSNRWLFHFEATHKAAIDQLAAMSRKGIIVD